MQAEKAEMVHFLLSYILFELGAVCQAYFLAIWKKLKARKTQNPTKKLKLKLKTQLFGIF